MAAIQSYLQAHHLPEERAILRLDGQYGTGAVLADLADLAYVMRGKDYQLLERAEIQARLKLPPDQQMTHPESGIVRTLYDCPEQVLGPKGKRCRIVVATHPATQAKSRVGVTRQGVVYELFLTSLPQGAFTAADVVGLYLHRSAFENALADEDQEQEPDRWYSYRACGQEFSQILCQWIWNLRLELGHALHPTAMRTTEFAPAALPAQEETARAPSSSQGYGPAAQALPWKQGRFSGRDFLPQADGTLRCPAGQALFAQERRRERDGSLRIVYAARIGQCRPCPLREQCQWHGRATNKPRRVSLLLHPLVVAPAPLLWGDWSRRTHRRACMQLLRSQRVEVDWSESGHPDPGVEPSPLSRAQRAHFRLCWPERLARNARPPTAGSVTIRLFGVPEALATFLGLATA